jgi:pimeloyl-ACP methyl ester carboxylesterase
MPLIAVNAHPEGLRLHADQGAPEAALRQALAGDGPVIVMIHGYKFAPADGRHCPHAHILSLAPRVTSRKAASWPARLGINDTEGGPVAIAFGWNARGLIWEVYRRAGGIGCSLAELFRTIREVAPHRPLHVLAHSLGARVFLAALQHVPANTVQRAVLLNGAEFTATADDALRTKAGASLELINVTSRENDLFDFLIERLIAPPRQGDKAIGLTMPTRDNTLTLQLDHPETLAALDRLGYPIAQPETHICHWSTYLRPGVFALYRAVFGLAGEMDIACLRAALPQATDPRWSRVKNRLVVRAAPWGYLPETGSPSSSGNVISTSAQ